MQTIDTKENVTLRCTNFLSGTFVGIIYTLVEIKKKTRASLLIS